MWAAQVEAPQLCSMQFAGTEENSVSVCITYVDGISGEDRGVTFITEFANVDKIVGESRHDVDVASGVRW